MCDIMQFHLQLFASDIAMLNNKYMQTLIVLSLCFKFQGCYCSLFPKFEIFANVCTSVHRDNNKLNGSSHANESCFSGLLFSL